MPRRWVTPAELLALGAIWGAAFLFMRIASPEIGAMPLALIRLALGGLVLAPFVWRARAEVLKREYWGQLLGISVLNSALPFAVFAWAAQYSPAGVIAIANSTTSLFAALIALVFFREKIGTVRAIALFAGFAGVVVLAGGRAAGLNVIEGAIAGTLAAASYAVSAILIRKHFASLPPVPVAGATLLVGAIVMSPLSLPLWPEHTVSTPAWLSALALGVLCTGVAYGIFFRLIQRVGAPRAVTVTYLVPVFAVFWGWWILNEPITPRMAVAATLILGAVALSHRRAGAASPPQS
jgi:drug/metabolite transporter (DMT)-like permease